MKGHVVVVGFPSRPSHLECFLRPLKGWTGGSDGEGGGRGVPVVLVAKTVDQLEGALEVVDRTGQINTRDVSKGVHAVEIKFSRSIVRCSENSVVS